MFPKCCLTRLFAQEATSHRRLINTGSIGDVGLYARLLIRWRRRPRFMRITRRAVWRARGVLDLPDLPGERDHVGGVPDELDRGRPVKAADDEC